MRFDKIYRKYKDDVYNYVYWRVMDREDALDITQEIFMKVYKNLDGFEKKSSIKTWIFAIARNTVTNFLTRSKRDFSELDESLFAGGNRRELEVKKEVLASLEKLSEDHKEIIRLYYFDGFSYRDMAELLDISIGTVKSRLKRAKEHLKKELEKKL